MSRRHPLTASFFETARLVGFILALVISSCTSPMETGTGDAGHPPEALITGFLPETGSRGSGDFTLTVRGRGFREDAQGSWDGAKRPTMFVNSTTIEMEISAQDVSEGGSGVVVVSGSSTSWTSWPIGFPLLPWDSHITSAFSLDLFTRDLKADPIREVVYAATEPDSPNYPNHVLALSPSDGAVLWAGALPAQPWMIAVSDDGSYLYVALQEYPRILRFGLPSGGLDLEIELRPAQWAEDVAPLVGQSHAIAVSLRNQSRHPSFRHVGVAVFDDDVQRGGTYSDWGHLGPERIEAATPSTLYGNHLTWSSFRFFVLSVTDAGVVELSHQQQVLVRDDIIFDSGYIFGTSHRVVDAEAMEVIGAVPNTGRPFPDLVNGRVFTIDGAALTAHHPLTYAQLGRVELPQRLEGAALARFGVDGVARGGRPALWFIRSPLIGG